MIQKKEKQSNYEVMRMFSMFMIVLWHVIGNNVPVDRLDSALSFIINLILFFLVVHVNSFVLLTGYFSTEKKTTLKKAISLLMTSWFYRIIFACIIFFSSLVPMSKVQFFQEIMPFDVVDYWFINCYLLLLMLIPFLNILIQNLTPKQHKNLLFVSFFLFSIVPVITNQGTVQNNGYTIIQFIFIYLLGAYLKKYPISKSYHFKHWSKRKMQLLFISVFFGAMSLNFLLSYCCKDLGMMNNSLLKLVGTTIKSAKVLYNNPLVIIQSVAYFCFFGTLNIKCKWINKISSLCFGVYLFHDNYYFKQIIYKPFDIGKQLNSWKLIPWCIMIAIILYISGLICEFLRRTICNLFLRIRKYFEKKYARLNKSFNGG